MFLNGFASSLTTKLEQIKATNYDEVMEKYNRFYNIIKKELDEVNVHLSNYESICEFAYCLYIGGYFNLNRRDNRLYFRPLNFRDLYLYRKAMEPGYKVGDYMVDLDNIGLLLKRNGNKQLEITAYKKNPNGYNCIITSNEDIIWKYDLYIYYQYPLAVSDFLRFIISYNNPDIDKESKEWKDIMWALHNIIVKLNTEFEK